MRVTVDRGMPLSLWGDDYSSKSVLNPPPRRRLPSVRANGVAWKFPAGMLVPLLWESALLREVEWMQLTGYACEYSDKKATTLSRTRDFSQPVKRVVLSPARKFEEMVKELNTGCSKADTKHISGCLSWPSALRQLSLGCVRNERVDWVALPRTLERLALGAFFNEPIELVSWPASLTYLTLGGYFNQSITDVVWPTLLMRLTFGTRFNRPIAEVV